MLHPVLAEAFDNHLMTWRLYDDLATSNAPSHRRLDARFKLEEARSNVGRFRRALHPEPRELRR